MAARKRSTRRPEGAEQLAVRNRILNAALAAFAQRGYTQTSTLEIATRARVSKRELYLLVGNKEDMLVACITERMARMPLRPETPAPDDRTALAHALETLGAALLREATSPTVIAVLRLAIAEAERAPEVARALDSIGTARAGLKTILGRARTSGLLGGEPAAMASQFAALLWGDLMVGLLLRVAEPPSPREIARRARDATTAFLQLHPHPKEPDTARAPSD